MSNIHQLAFLQRQKSELEALVSEAVLDGDIVAKMNFSARLEVIADELEQLIGKDIRVGEVAVLFDGAPVTGTTAIDANFAALALTYFQGIVARLYAASLKGQLSSRGKIKGARLAGLNIRGVATGSFGFVLEEKDANQVSVFKTPVREALEEAAALFDEFTQEDDDEFLVEVDDINPRVFMALAKFFRHLESNSATLKTNFPDKLYSFDRAGIERAYKRIAASKVKIETEFWVGTLVGLSPIKRTFDFRCDGSDAIISGKFSHQISQDYLERIETKDGITLGDHFNAKIEIGTIRKPDGTISVTHTVIEMTESKLRRRQ